MGKLKSPSCLLAGTPLSADEMKQITGGMEFSRTCVCEFYSQGKMILSTHPKINSESECETACKNQYTLESAKYDAYSYVYTVVG
jgi:hypothetical protein